MDTALCICDAMIPVCNAMATYYTVRNGQEAKAALDAHRAKQAWTQECTLLGEDLSCGNCLPRFVLKDWDLLEIGAQMVNQQYANIWEIIDGFGAGMAHLPGEQAANEISTFSRKSSQSLPSPFLSPASYCSIVCAKVRRANFDGLSSKYGMKLIIHPSIDGLTPQPPP